MPILGRLALIFGICFCAVTTNLSAQQQSSQPATGSAASSSPASKRDSVSPTQAVITVHGVCNRDQASAADAGECATNMTREQFENMLNAFNPSGQPITDTARQNFARAYAELVALESAARRSGVEDTPEFRLLMDALRMKTAGDLYRQSLERKFRNPSPDEVAAYYRQHQAEFERVKLSRILVPRSSPGTNAAEIETKALDVANTAHDRAAKGEDVDKIQKDAYSALGLANPPATELGTYGRSDMIEKESADVFALHEGEVTRVEVEPSSYVIYKVTRKETLPLDQAKAKIARTIEEQKLKEAIRAATDTAPAEFNEQYFGPGMKNLPVVNVPQPSHSAK